MKRFIVLFAATITFAVPAVAASASTTGRASQPQYRPECENLYQQGKAVFDPAMAHGKAIFAPMEQAFCGAQKHTR
jgi:hypothetical protein